jgi:hypothetical protein
MKKMLLVIDATYVNTNTLDFACYLASLSHSKLTGVFLDNHLEDAALAISLAYGAPFSGMVVSGTEQKRSLCKDNISIFREACSKKNISYSIHHDRNVPAEEIIGESRFSDLIILDAKTSFDIKAQEAPTGFVKKVLMEAECPVIVAPECFTAIDEIVFAYDGSASSVFAIKQFTYLFPELDEKKVTLLQINEADSHDVEKRHQVAEWLKSHYSVINIATLNGKMKNVLFGYLAGKKDLIIVMGAFGRSSFSQFLKSSSAEPVIRAVNLPVFIAHR